MVYVTVDPSYRDDLDGEELLVVNDATRWNKVALLRLAWRLFRILRTIRPQAIITTGAAPGYLALRMGRRFGARTIWLDSVANVEELSLSGRRVGPHCDLWLTQWASLERPEGPKFRGAVL